MGVAGSMNIQIKADLTKYVAHRPSVLYWVLQPGSNVGGIGMGVVRMVRPWNEWLLIWGYDINQPAPHMTEESCREVAWNLIGDRSIPVDVTSWSTWTVNHMYATSTRRVACSAWVTRCTATRRATDSAPIPRFRTRTTCAGSSLSC